VDPANPPGTYRKVGPGLRRLAEKTNQEWTRKWIQNPRGFREDTKMPHFYNVSNNSADSLKGTGQEKFPATEIHSIAYYLLARARPTWKARTPIASGWKTPSTGSFCSWTWTFGRCCRSKTSRTGTADRRVVP